MRDLVRARTSAVEDLRAARQRLQGFLLRHDRIYSGRSHWTQAHRRRLAGLGFDHAAQQIVFQEYLHAIDDAEARRDRLTRQIRELLPCWSMAPLVAALQAMRGVALLAAVTLVAEIGDFRRFANPRQLMAYLGLVPSEYSSGKRVARGRITKAGNSHARRVLVEGAWTYRMPARVSPHVARASGWLAQRGPRDCLDGAGSVVCATGVWSPRENPRPGHHGDRPRDGRLCLGRRPTRRADTGGLTEPKRNGSRSFTRRTTKSAVAQGWRRHPVGQPSVS